VRGRADGEDREEKRQDERGTSSAAWKGTVERAEGEGVRAAEVTVREDEEREGCDEPKVGR
jgi:hypothetical protein